MPRGITEDDVFAAADALLIRGERPTIERVRQELGRGSPNTVNRMLDLWWAQLAKRMGTQPDQGLPSSIAEACRRLYLEIQAQTRREADAVSGESAKLMAEQRQQLERDTMALASEKAGVLATMDTWRSEMVALSQENRVSMQRMAELETTLTAERKAASSATAGFKNTVEEKDKAIANLEHEIERVRGQWQGNETRWLREIDHLRTEAKRFRGEHEKQAAAYERRIADLEKRLDRALTENAALTANGKQLETALIKERETRVKSIAPTRKRRASSKQRLKRIKK